MFLNRVKSDLCLFVLFRPPGCPVSCLLQLADFPQMLFIFSPVEIVLLLLILPPAAEIALFHPDRIAVQHQHVVNTGIQQFSVVRDQDKSFFAF